MLVVLMEILSDSWKRTDHIWFISDFVFKLNVQPHHQMLPGLYHLHHPWNSYNILPLEMEGIHSATDKALVWQTRGREIKSWSRRGRSMMKK